MPTILSGENLLFFLFFDPNLPIFGFSRFGSTGIIVVVFVVSALLRLCGVSCFLQYICCEELKNVSND